MNETHDVIDRIETPSQTAPIALPNSGGILAMGIISIVFVGLIGLVLGIISVTMGSKALKEYNLNPSKYTVASYKNAKAGRICGIIGLSLLGFVLVIMLVIAAAAA